jgi:hypothetical protein
MPGKYLESSSLRLSNCSSISESKMWLRQVPLNFSSKKSSRNFNFYSKYFVFTDIWHPSVMYHVQKCNFPIRMYDERIVTFPSKFPLLKVFRYATCLSNLWLYLVFFLTGPRISFSCFGLTFFTSSFYTRWRMYVRVWETSAWSSSVVGVAPISEYGVLKNLEFRALKFYKI